MPFNLPIKTLSKVSKVETTDRIIFSDLNHDLTIHGGDIYLYQNYDSIIQSIWTILNTKKGEVPFLYDFGMDLNSFVFEQNSPELFKKLEAHIKDTIEYWDNRVSINFVSVIDDEETNKLLVDIEFILHGSDKQYKNSFVLNK